MGFRNFEPVWSRNMILEGMISFYRFHSSKPGVVDLKKLRPMILKRIEERAKKYPIKTMIPVAHEVLKARSILYQGVSILLQHFPVMSCRWIHSFRLLFSMYLYCYFSVICNIILQTQCNWERHTGIAFQTFTWYAWENKWGEV